MLYLLTTQLFVHVYYGLCFRLACYYGTIASNCQIIYYGNLVQVFMLYDGECTYLNISRAFIVLGILGAIFSVIFVTYSLIKRLGDQG